ncbi:MAG: C25 family cysteine peptidase [Acidobacteriota bacterium]|nr:C25 family cysteine peptidase [Acidobacteriota bacterium]
MKKISVGIIFLFLFLAVNFPISAQRAKDVKNIKATIKFNKTEAFSDGQGVWLEWQMDLESNNLGFQVYRIDGDGKQVVNRGLISGAYLETGEAKSTGRKYSFFDAGGDLDSVYYIETLNINGQKNTSSRFSAQSVKDLSKISGISSETLKSNAITSNPTVLKDENILPPDLQSEVTQGTIAPDAARQLWVAAQPGVKMAVSREGIYRVTRAELLANGFDVNAPTALWQLYVNGNEQAINVGGNGDYIEFYGRGIDTLEANAQIYYLVVGATNGKRIGTTIRRPIGVRVLAGNYAQSFTKKDRFIYSSSILNGDAENFFGSAITSSGAAITFSLTGIDFSSANSTFDIGIQGLTETAHQTRVILNSHDIGSVNGNQRDLSRQHFDIPTSYLLEGANNLQLTALQGSGDNSLFESVKIGFARKYQAQQNRLSFYTANYRASYLENFTSPDIRVFDVTYSDSPTLITGMPVEQNGGTYRVYLPAVRGRVMYAVEDTAILPVDSIIRNVPSTLSTSNHDADLLIITYKDWAAQANDWAAYRRAQGMSVEVVDIEDVYDEFNFGVLSSLSIRNFLQFASSKWHTKPNYVLLIGDATYDPKNYLSGGFNDFIPTRLVDTLYTETGSDDALADFNDDGLAELAIGRLPVKNGQTVTQLLNKVTTFEQTVGQGLTRGVIFASDLPNGYDFEGLSNRLRQQLPPTVNSFMINRAAPNARTQLLTEINNGRFLVNYSGHGTTAAWVDSSFLSSSDVAQMTNTKLSIFTMLTCLNGYFISPNPTAAGDSFAEVLLKGQNGAVASWASSGLTTPDIQEIMATHFYGQIGAGNFSRLGDLVKDAKTSINGGRDVRLSWVLLGDPTLKIK